MFVKCWGTSRQHFEPMGVGTQSALQAAGPSVASVGTLQATCGGSEASLPS